MLFLSRKIMDIFHRIKKVISKYIQCYIRVPFAIAQTRRLEWTTKCCEWVSVSTTVCLVAPFNVHNVMNSGQIINIICRWAITQTIQTIKFYRANSPIRITILQALRSIFFFLGQTNERTNTSTRTPCRWNSSMYSLIYLRELSIGCT